MINRKIFCKSGFWFLRYARRQRHRQTHTDTVITVNQLIKTLIHVDRPQRDKVHMVKIIRHLNCVLHCEIYSEYCRPHILANKELNMFVSVVAEKTAESTLIVTARIWS